MNYLELLAAVLAFAGALVLFFLARRVLDKLKDSRAAGPAFFVSGVILPVAFLIFALLLKLDILRKVFSLGQKFYEYLNAAIIFLAVLLIIRLADSWLLYRYKRRQVSFPLPGVLRGFILFVFYLVVLFIVL